MLVNLFADVPSSFPKEICQTLLNAGNIRIERILSQGHASPEGFWYDQSEHEWVLVVGGSARVRFEGEEPVELTSGSFINIPAHQRHRVEWTDPTGPTIWLAIYYSSISRTT